jgi:hypothetical protein
VTTENKSTDTTTTTGGTGGGTGGGGGGGGSSVTVTLTAPADASLLVDITTSVTVTFSAAMNASTLTVNTNTACSGSIQVSDTNFATCIPLTGTVGGSGTTFTITPAANLSTTSIYKVRVTSAAKDLLGTAVTAYAHTTGFTTDKYVSTVATIGTGAIDSPFGVVVDSSDNIYVSTNDHKIKKITQAGVVTVLAGSGTAGSTDATGAAASFNLPRHMAMDASNNIYVTEQGNHRIRKVTPAGVVTTVAGSTSGYADGTGAAAKFNLPYGIVIDSNGDLIVGEQLGCRIRKVTTAGVVTTIAGNGTCAVVDGTGAGAQFGQITGMVRVGNDIFVADNRTLRFVNITSNPGLTQTAFGASGVSGYIDGVGTASRFSTTYGLATDGSNRLYIADSGNNVMRTTLAAIGSTTTTFAGSTSGFQDGPLNTAKFATPAGMARSPVTGALYFVEQTGYRLRRIN